MLQPGIGGAFGRLLSAMVFAFGPPETGSESTDRWSITRPGRWCSIHVLISRGPGDSAYVLVSDPAARAASELWEARLGSEDSIDGLIERITEQAATPAPSPGNAAGPRAES